MQSMQAATRESIVTTRTSVNRGDFKRQRRRFKTAGPNAEFISNV